MRRLFLTALAAGLAALVASAAAETSIVILDSSGSMAADMDGQTRLDAARKVLLDDIAARPAGTSLGLVVYGHRRAGDCGDIETVTPPGPIDLSRMQRDFARLRARGKTPLSASLRHAAGLLPKEGGTILLVSDGLETCREDPCAVARDLRAANAKVRIHVVGFGLKPEETEALACIAQEGGGTIHAAEDAQALSEALADVTQDAAPAAESTAETSQQPVSEPTPVPVHFVAVAKGRELLAGVPLGWRVFAQDAAEPLYEGGGEGIALTLKPGRYTVELKGANAVSRSAVTVGEAGGPPLEIPIEIGRLRLALTAGKGIALEDFELRGDLAWTVEPLEGQAGVTDPAGDTPDLALAPGRYRISVTVAGRSATGDVQVENGARTDLTLSLALGRLTLEAAMDETGAALDGGTGLSWRIEGGAGEPQRFDAVARPVAILPAGRYRVILSVDGAEIGADATVADGEQSTARVVLGAGTVTLEGSLGPGGEAFADWRDTQWTVTPVRVLGGASVGAALTDHAEARPVLKLMPGEWEAKLVSGAAKVTKRFAVRPGVSETVRLDQAAARTRIVVGAGGQEAGAALVEVYGPFADGAYPAAPLVTAGISREYTHILAAGRYRIVASDQGGRKGEAEADLAAGENRTIEIDLR